MLAMLGQAIPIALNLSSPVTWFVVTVALIVLALTVSTRRGNVRPRRDLSEAPSEPLSAGARARYTADWSAAQALFVDDPRAGCERARTIVANVLRDRGLPMLTPEPLDRRYHAGCEIAANAYASTDDLRGAFIDFRSVFDVLLVAPPGSGR